MTDRKVIKQQHDASETRQKRPYGRYIGPKMCWGQETLRNWGLDDPQYTQQLQVDTMYLMLARLCLRWFQMKTTLDRQASSVKYKTSCSPTPDHLSTGQEMCFIIIRSKPNRHRTCSGWFAWVWFVNLCCRLTNDFKVDCTWERTRSVRFTAAAALVVATSWINSVWFVHLNVKLKTNVVPGSPVSVLKGWINFIIFNDSSSFLDDGTVEYIFQPITFGRQHHHSGMWRTQKPRHYLASLDQQYL